MKNTRLPSRKYTQNRNVYASRKLCSKIDFHAALAGSSSLSIRTFGSYRYIKSHLCYNIVFVKSHFAASACVERRISTTSKPKVSGNTPCSQTRRNKSPSDVSVTFLWVNPKLWTRVYMDTKNAAITVKWHSRTLGLKLLLIVFHGARA